MLVEHYLKSCFCVNVGIGSTISLRFVMNKKNRAVLETCTEEVSQTDVTKSR